METIKIQNRETGTVIELASTMQEAKNIVKSYEEEDRNNGEFIENFYEIVEG